MTLPAVSVLMPAYNAARFIGHALQTVLASTLRDIEVLVVDDASTDATVLLVTAIAAGDPRVRLFRCASNGGPSVARNIGLDHARGRWVAIVDADDLVHPARFEQLLHQAEAGGAEIACDNLLVFDDAGRAAPYAFLAPATGPRAVDIAEYVRGNVHNRRGEMLGYLKPLFRTDFLRRTGIRYRPALRVAQDFGFVLDLMGAGARLLLYPGLTYFYRRHPASHSFRLRRSDIVAMMAADAAVAAAGPALPTLAAAFSARRAGFEQALDYDTILEELRRFRWGRAAASAWRRPSAAMLLHRPIGVRLRRLLPRRPAPGPRPPTLCLLTDQPDASSLATIATAARRAGYRVRHLCLAPPRAGWRARILFRLGYAPPAAQALLLARHGRMAADVVIAHGTAAVAAVPFLLRPDAPVLALLPPGQVPAGRVDAVLATDLARPPSIPCAAQPNAAALRRFVAAIWPGVTLPT